MRGGKQIQVEKFLQFSDVFSEQPKTLAHYLQNIPKSVLLKAASHFLGYFNRQSKYVDNYMDFLLMYFQKDNLEIFQVVVSAIKKMESQFPEWKVRIVNHQTSLILFEYAYQHGLEIEKQIDFDTKLFEINLFKAYLLINEDLDKKQTAEIKKLEGFPPHDKIRKIMLILSLPDMDLINHNETDVFVCQLLKANWLFSFLKIEPRCQPILSALFQHYQAEKQEDIFNHLIHLGILCMERKEGRLGFNVAQDEFFKANSTFLDSLTVETTENQEDFKNLRATPIYKEKEGTYCIICPLFVLEKLYKSWYFKLNQINNQLPKHQKIKEFRSFYGQNFTENYLIEKVLDGIFNPKSIQLSGNKIRKEYSTVTGEPDYYVRDWNRVYIFETKDTFLRAENKTSYSFEAIETDLREKLYFKTDDKGKITPKAVKQITENIKKSLQNKQLFDSLSKPNKVEIYPILLLHDESFNAAGLNSLVNEWFQKELEELKNQGFNIKKVNPLIIITIDALILLQELMRQKKIMLHELLEKYSKTRLSTPKANKNPIKQEDYLPFSAFALNYARSQKFIPMPNISFIHSATKNLVFSKS